MLILWSPKAGFYKTSNSKAKNMHLCLYLVALPLIIVIDKSC